MQDALQLIMKSLLALEPWERDPRVVPIPWRQIIVDQTLSRSRSDGSSNDRRPLKLGIFWSDGVVTPQPPIQRGLHLLVNAVRESGHQVKANLQSFMRAQTVLTDTDRRVEASVPTNSKESTCEFFSMNATCSTRY